MLWSVKVKIASTYLCVENIREKVAADLSLTERSVCRAQISMCPESVRFLKQSLPATMIMSSPYVNFKIII